MEEPASRDGDGFRCKTIVETWFVGTWRLGTLDSKKKDSEKKDSEKNVEP
jgi:hypothetical protein